MIKINHTMYTQYLHALTTSGVSSTRETSSVTTSRNDKRDQHLARIDKRDRDENHQMRSPQDSSYVYTLRDDERVYHKTVTECKLILFYFLYLGDLMFRKVFLNQQIFFSQRQLFHYIDRGSMTTASLVLIAGNVVMKSASLDTSKTN